MWSIESNQSFTHQIQHDRLIKWTNSFVRRISFSLFLDRAIAFMFKVDIYSFT